MTCQSRSQKSVKLLVLFSLLNRQTK